MIMPNFPDGTLDRGRHYYALRVYYEDTDLSGITYHANYLRWFERARSDLLRQLEIDQRAAIESGGGAYAVADGKNANGQRNTQGRVTSTYHSPTLGRGIALLDRDHIAHDREIAGGDLAATIDELELELLLLRGGAA